MARHLFPSCKQAVLTHSTVAGSFSHYTAILFFSRNSPGIRVAAVSTKMGGDSSVSIVVAPADLGSAKEFRLCTPDQIVELHSPVLPLLQICHLWIALRSWRTSACGHANQCVHQKTPRRPCRHFQAEEQEYHHVCCGQTSKTKPGRPWEPRILPWPNCTEESR